MSKKNPKPGYVYIAHAEKTSRYKIGYTNNLDQRLRELNGKQAPYPIVYIHHVYVINASSVESFLHSKYADYGTHNEWFEFTELQLNHLLGDMKFFAQMSFNLSDNKFKELDRRLEILPLIIQTTQQNNENIITSSSDIQDHQNTPKSQSWWKKNYEKINIFENRYPSYKLSMTPLEHAFFRWCRNNSIYDKPMSMCRKKGLSNFQFNDDKHIAIYLQYLDYVSPSIVYSYLGQYLFATEIDKKSALNIQSYGIVFVANDINLASEIYQIIFKILLSLTDDTCVFIGYVDDSPAKKFALYAKIGEQKK